MLAEDETDLLLFPPLRAMWSLRGVPAEVLLSGWNARRTVFGCMNLATGNRLFQVRHRQRAEDFQAFLHHVHRQYRGWRVTLLLDSDRSHTAMTSQTLAAAFGIQLLWLAKRAPELPWIRYGVKVRMRSARTNNTHQLMNKQPISFIIWLA
ncbi:MAG TPA: transposase [Noviherbaspirillum sp.]